MLKYLQQKKIKQKTETYYKIYIISVYLNASLM